jgi:hypothetical protein
MGRHAFALIVALASSLGAAPALAKRVVVLEFVGPQDAATAEIQDSLIELVGAEHTVVSATQYLRIQQRMDLEAPSDANVAAIARELGLHGVIIGSVTEQGKSLAVRIGVRAGNGGKLRRWVKLRLPREEFADELEREVERRVMPLLAGLPEVARATQGKGKGRARVDFDAEEEEEAPAAAARQPGKRGAGTRRGRVEVAAEEESEESEEEEGPTSPRGPAFIAGAEEDAAEADAAGDGAPAADPRPAAVGGVVRATPAAAHPSMVELSVGGSFVARKLSLRVSEGTSTAGLAYEGTPSVGVLASADLFPFARQKGGLAGLGLTGLADVAVQIETTYVQGEMRTALPTEQRRFGAGLVYRHAFGDPQRRPSVRVSARINQLSFKVDRGNIEGYRVPDVEYLYIDPGLGVRVPLHPRIAVVGEARGLAVLGTGQIQKSDQLGAARVVGYDAEAGLELRLGTQVLVRLAGKYLAFAYDFKGYGTLAKDDAGNQTVGGALDQYLGGYTTVGVMF